MKTFSSSFPSRCNFTTCSRIVLDTPYCRPNARGELRPKAGAERTL
jgi:hypothetical protein